MYTRVRDPQGALHPAGGLAPDPQLLPPYLQILATPRTTTPCRPYVQHHNTEEDAAHCHTIILYFFATDSGMLPVR